MKTKGKKVRHYPLFLKEEAVRLYEEGGRSYESVARQLDLQDRFLVRAWVRKFRKQGADGLIDRRGNPFREETEQGRRVRRLELEVDVLKKWLEILNREVIKGNTK